MDEMEKTRLVAQYLYEHNLQTTLHTFLKESGTEFVGWCPVCGGC